MPIHILPSDLSSQISAGEIIERPASVVKEIIENSIDSGAKNIHITIEKSGFQSIILYDDGCGIDKEDLQLAIKHHATSKIRSLSDLNTITTFGFRGEALASIRAVSRLTLISCTKFNDVAWKIYVEGFTNNNIVLQPIAHPQGTTIIVENLFYNMPVRLKFMNNIKLEFIKVIEVVKKIALSHFYINFSLNHNNKLIIKYNSIKNENRKIFRLNDILGKCINIRELVSIKSKKNNVFLFGWISYPQDLKKTKNIQYCYINNRFVNNNYIFINAVFNAYLSIFGNKNISFVLYLTIPSNQIDINIHPTKREIKFHQPNLIYNFIYDTIFHNLKKLKKQYLEKIYLFSKKINLPKNEKYNCLYSFNPIFSKLTSLFYLKKNVVSKNTLEKQKNILLANNFFKQQDCILGKLLIIIHNYYGLIHHSDNFSLISLPLAKGIVRKEKLKNNIKNNIIPKNFSTIIKFNITSPEHKILFHNKEMLSKIGFNLILKKKYVIFSSIPHFFKKKNLNTILSDFFIFLFSKNRVLISEIINWFYNKIFIELKNWNYINGIAVLAEMEYYCPLFLRNPPEKLLQKIDINAALYMLKI